MHILRIDIFNLKRRIKFVCLGKEFMKQLLLICILFGSSYCLPAQNLSQDDREAILIVMDHQEQAWNRGDVDAFMEGYWKSDSLVFMGSAGPKYGWDHILQDYKQRYPSRQSMGMLTFYILQLKALNENHAFMIGQWDLRRDGGDIGGFFTLVWKKINGKWLIISDHTS